MHEYGHTFDSRRFGPLYLVYPGIPSLLSAAFSKPITTLIYSHDIRWYEMSANNHAADYFSTYYGVDWSSDPHYIHPNHTIEDFYPR